jgi:hypothetical protein
LVVRYETDGTPVYPAGVGAVQNHQAKLGAQQQCDRIAERVSRLLGLDAPVRHEIEDKRPVDSIDEALRVMRETFSDGPLKRLTGGQDDPEGRPSLESVALGAAGEEAAVPPGPPVH